MLTKIFGEIIPSVKHLNRIGAYLIPIQNDKVATVKNHKGHFLIGGGMMRTENHIWISCANLEEKMVVSMQVWAVRQCLNN